MSPSPIRTTLIALALGALLTAGGCSPAPAEQREISCSGTVRDDVLVVSAPLLQRPVFDPRVGLPGARTVGAARPAAPSVPPTLSAAVATVTVTEGARVETGQVLARLDDRDLVIGVEIARTAAARWHADARVIDQRLADLNGTAHTLADKRSQVLDALAQARAGRAKLVGAIAQLQAVASKLPPGPWPWPGPGPDPRVTLPRLKAQLAQLDAGLAKASTGLRKLDDAKAKLSDARTTIEGARSVLALAARAADAAVPVAEARRAQSVLVAPASGAVVSIVQPGTVLMADAPVARIRRVGAGTVDSYVTPSDAARLSVGTTAEVSIDSRPGERLRARVTDMRPVFEYPPSSLSTSEIHMSRAFRVTVALDDPSVPLPAGTPADLVIRP